jgi:hypothetical protein
MRFAVAQQTDVATRCLWPPRPVGASQAGVVGEMVAKFWDQQSHARIMRLLARRSATLFLGWWTAESIWLLV